MKLRRVVLGVVAAFALAAISTSARAAEPWTGFYLGLQLGGAWGDSDVTYPSLQLSTNNTRFLSLIHI